MTLSRRRFLQSGGALATTLLAPGWPRAARAARSEPVLVALFLRGAADGLNLVIPSGDPDYYALRPDIQVAPGDELPLDGFFGLNPSLGALLPIYTDGDLVFVHAAGSHDPTRSHFVAEDFMERAAPGDPFISEGWLNRALSEFRVEPSWSGVSMGPALASSLRGAHPALAMPSLDRFVFGGSEVHRWLLENLYRGARNAELQRAAEAGFAALDVVGAVPRDDAVTYPRGPFGDTLRDAAALIRADIGVRTVTLDLVGWDHHEGEVAALADLCPVLAAGLASFRLDLGEHWQRSVVLVMTEFGRTAGQNGTLGTDHGHGSAMLVAGGGVAGGRVITRNGWPGLASGRLYEGRDLAVTTDFRDVFAEVLQRHMRLGRPATHAVLPGHDVRGANFPGIFG